MAGAVFGPAGRGARLEDIVDCRQTRPACYHPISLLVHLEAAHSVRGGGSAHDGRREAPTRFPFAHRRRDDLQPWNSPRPRCNTLSGRFRRMPRGAALPETDPSWGHLRRPPVPPAGAPNPLCRASETGHLRSVAAARRMLSSGEAARCRMASASMALCARSKFSISRPLSSRTWPVVARVPTIRSMSGRGSVV